MLVDRIPPTVGKLAGEVCALAVVGLPLGCKDMHTVGDLAVLGRSM